MTMRLRMRGPVIRASAKTDLRHATTRLRVTTDRGVQQLRIWLARTAPLLIIQWPQDDVAPAIELLGWERQLPGLAMLNTFDYPHAIRQNQHLVQPIGEQRHVIFAYRQWDGCAAVTMNVGPHDNPRQSEAALAQAEKNPSETLTAHRRTWRTYWGRSDLVIPDIPLQRTVDLARYQYFCNAAVDAPPMTLQGVWNQDREMPPWLGDLHNDLNASACQWMAHRLNLVDLAHPLAKLFTEAVPIFQDRGKRFYGVADGAQVPVLMTTRGTAARARWDPWNTMLGPELFAAFDVCADVDYSTNEMFRDEYAVPFLRAVCRLYEELAEYGEDGRLHLPITQSPEYRHDGNMLLPDSTFALSCLRHIIDRLTTYLDASECADEAGHWRQFGRQLALEPTSEHGLDVWPGVAVDESHRHFSHLFPIFPLDQLDVQQPEDATIIERSLDRLWALGSSEFMCFSFPWIALLAARAWRGNMALLALSIFRHTFLSRSGFIVNGDVRRTGIIKPGINPAGHTNDAMTLESGLMVPAAVADMLVHRVKNSVRLLPAIPDDWQRAQAENVRLPGGHVISLSMRHGRLQYLTVKAGSTDTLTFTCPRWAKRYHVQPTSLFDAQRIDAAEIDGREFHIHHGDCIELTAEDPSIFSDRDGSL